jgi:hypothetical protein
MIALAPRTVQNIPDCFRRELITVLQPASITPEPMNRQRQISQLGDMRAGSTTNLDERPPEKATRQRQNRKTGCFAAFYPIVQKSGFRDTKPLLTCHRGCGNQFMLISSILHKRGADFRRFLRRRTGYLQGPDSPDPYGVLSSKKERTKSVALGTGRAA